VKIHENISDWGQPEKSAKIFISHLVPKKPAKLFLACAGKIFEKRSLYRARQIREKNFWGKIREIFLISYLF
jgi:hypothetical protein